jgi:hypothetical protein
MTTQIMELCGVFLGDVIRSQPANPQGQCEHRKIIDKIQKAHLRRNKFDPKGQKPLPPRNWHEKDPSRKDMVLKIMKHDGLSPHMIWGFKDSKASLDWRTWNDHFPNAYWVVTERKDEEIKSLLEKELFKKFAPEFINRFDDIVYFKDLNQDDLLKIVDLELNKFYERIEKLEYTVEVDDTLKKHLTEVGTDTRFGARILKRTVQKWVDDAITEKILTDNPEKGSKYILTYNEKEKKTDVKIKKPTKRKK